MPLDEITCRMFPTLARYARKMKRLGLLAVAVVIFTGGLACGLLVGSYRGQVTDESYQYQVREFNQFKEDYLKRFAKDLRVTAAQARVIVTERERERQP